MAGPVLLPVTLENVFSLAAAESVVCSMAVSRNWMESARSEHVWKQHCTTMWADKVYVPKKFRDADGVLTSYLTSYWESLKDSKRCHIKAEELCTLEWWCRMKSSAGPEWTQRCPWWQQGEAQKRRYHMDGTCSSVRGEGTWRFIPECCGRKGPKGSFVRMSLNFREFPTHVVSRYEKNWGFIIQNCWGFSASFPLPPQGFEPELEDAGEICQSVSISNCQKEAQDYNIGKALPYALAPADSDDDFDPSPNNLYSVFHGTPAESVRWHYARRHDWSTWEEQRALDTVSWQRTSVQMMVPSVLQVAPPTNVAVPNLVLGLPSRSVTTPMPTMVPHRPLTIPVGIPSPMQVRFPRP